MILKILELFGAEGCGNGSFLGFPTWHKYLSGDMVGGRCELEIDHLNDIWAIVAAVLEMVLRGAALLAVVFIIVGGIQYIGSQGEPENIQHAKNTIVNAVVGLVIATMATVIVSFVAGIFN